MFLLKPSFAGGEISPALYGRTDFAKYDNGAAQLKNFIVQRYGGIANRAGTKFIAKAPGFAVLRPFKYSSSENYMIEFSNHRIRVFSRDKKIVADIAKLEDKVTDIPYSFSDVEKLRLIKYTQSADVMFLVHPEISPLVLYRDIVNGQIVWKADWFANTDGPFEDPNTTDAAISSSAKEGVVTLTASQNYFTEDMVGNVLRLGHTVGSQYVTGVPAANGMKTATMTQVATSGRTTVLNDVPTGYALQSVTVTAAYRPSPQFTYNANANSITIPEQRDDEGEVISVSYTVTRTFSYEANYLQVECVPGGTVYVESFGFWKGNFSLEKFVDGIWTKVRTQEGNHSSNYNFTETNNHTSIIQYRITSTEFDTTFWENENTKQPGHVTLQTFSQDYYGIALITDINSPTSAQATVVKRLGDAKATKDFSLGPWSDAKGYPMCAGFYEDRLVFAGSKRYGQTFWMSKSGDYYNFGSSIPTVDTDAITGSLNGGQMNGIKAMVAFGELILLTAGGEHKVSGGNNQAVAPSKVRAQAQEYRGISDVAPVTVGSRIVYIQQQGDIVRDLAYTYEADKYTGDDINLLAQHLFEGHKLVSMSYQQTPNSVIWIVRDDGLLLGLTYLKEQDVFAWHKHETVDGQFIDVASIAGEREDELWCVVKRGEEYFIEVMAERDKSEEVADQYFVDCGVQAENGEGLSTVEGLEHLEGKTVAILADGFVLPQQKVVNGAVNLGHAYHKVSVGLPVESVMETLPLEVTGQDGSTISRRKRVHKLLLMFKNSSGGRYGLSESRLDEIKWRSTEPYGVAIKLYSGKQEILMPSASFEKTVQIMVKQNEPLPLTILSIVPEMQVGG